MNIVLFSSVLLTACRIQDEIDKFKDDVGELTNEFVVSAFYVGAEEFEYSGISFSDIEQLKDVQSVVYLANADVTGESEPSPISRAQVSATTFNVDERVSSDVL